MGLYHVTLITMEALAAYGSESDEERRLSDEESEDEVPEHDAFGLESTERRAPREAASALVVRDVAPAVEAEEAAPAAPAADPNVRQTRTGAVEETTMSDFDFRNQQRTFEMMGYARNPSTFAAASQGALAYVGDRHAAQEMGGATMAELRGGNAETRRAARALKKRRKANGDASIVDGAGAYQGPWAAWEEEHVVALPKGQLGPTKAEITAAETGAVQRQQEHKKLERRREIDEMRGTEKSIFHGESMYDYQGRTYMHIPTDAGTNLRGEPGSQQCFIPQTCIHTFTGHTKAVHAVRLFPQSGHLVLSGSMDTKVKLWDVYHQGNCLRTFLGHAKGVRDVRFNNDGRQFLSSGYDNMIKLWDTETGACLQTYPLDGVGNCVVFYPEHDDIFLTGTSDKKILQYDLRSKELVQEYNQHQGAVNTITFVDENRRFLSTSDDKSMRAWDFDIPVVTKYIADPHMHSIPSVALHPDEKWLACQSMDNQILVYNADTYKQSQRRAFKGHSVAGFACQVAFSPDGRFLSSGDSQGNLVFWDWKTGGLIKRLPAHKDAMMSHAWLPHETSKVITGAWDGLLKLWT